MFIVFFRLFIRFLSIAAFSKTDKQKSNSDKVLYKEKIVDMEQIEHDNKMDEEIFNSSSKDMFETPGI